ncbi:DNA polymerase III subunit delta' [Helicobacter baculiformis]|uniref:DNA polymerase III subunit delta n=1 Tax=Helicobacter baculiformis TaxID=427351 RepID=A0ABV7ZL19_9HELI|nr:DNA polymerase III subunit delta' [Helicobacter baculiformis]
MSNLLILANAPKQEALTYQEEIASQQPLAWVESFVEDELKIEHAHEIKCRCVLSHTQQKIYIIAAHHFNTFAQNALLKILEEPPLNTRFVLIAKHKHALLSTLLSRLSYEDRRVKVAHERFGLNLRTCTLADIYAYVQDLDKAPLNPEETKTQIQAFLYALQESAIPLPMDMLESIDQAMHANHLYYRASYNLLPLLLRVLELREA